MSLSPRLHFYESTREEIRWHSGSIHVTIKIEIEIEIEIDIDIDGIDSTGWQCWHDHTGMTGACHVCLWASVIKIISGRLLKVSLGMAKADGGVTIV